MNIKDSGLDDKTYVTKQLSDARKARRKVQRQFKDKREAHLEELAEHYASNRQTTKQTEIKKIKQSKEIRTTSAKHKWYLKERYGMIRTLLVQDYRLHQILSVLGVLPLSAMLGRFTKGGNVVRSNDILVRDLSWSVFTVWGQLTANDGLKVLTYEDQITERILQRNGT